MTFGPLRGVRVVELAAIGPAPFACMLLADLGADVVRVDRPGERAFGAWHRVLDRGRQSIAVDLKHPAGQEVVLRLVERADVLVEGYRPGVAERLGLGPADCRRRNPALVYGRMTGWGQVGSLAATAGHDINYIALTGALHAIGDAGGPPVPPLNLLGDFAGGGLFLANGILAALVERERSGIGQVVDASIVDGTVVLLAMLLAMEEAGAWRPGRGTNLLDGGAPFYTIYECADGGHVAVGALEERFYHALVAGLGLDAAPLPDRDDPANWPALRELFASRFAERDRDEWARVFEATDACVTPVLSTAEAMRHPHLAQRRTFTEQAQPAPAPRFSRSGSAPPRSAPRVGADTRRVLAAGCGLSKEEIERLIRAGAVWSIDAPASGE
ncbi:MAG TPA: CaiB/BaiF CoA-transferase family protein [Candidatus Limnocylindrales bacterium]|nr:CaiB/BaiF CoA-transferase family protein [Candidatus Limnocylindrales bacterium]